MNKQASQTIEDRLALVETRNKRVEGDKAWETSWTRRLSIVVLTYAVVVIWLSIIHNNNPWINATVPPIGFFLSTLTVSLLKKGWLSKYL